MRRPARARTVETADRRSRKVAHARGVNLFAPCGERLANGIVSAYVVAMGQRGYSMQKTPKPVVKE